MLHTGHAQEQSSKACESSRKGHVTWGTSLCCTSAPQSQQTRLSDPKIACSDTGVQDVVVVKLWTIESLRTKTGDVQRHSQEDQLCESAQNSVSALTSDNAAADAGERLMCA